MKVLVHGFVFLILTICVTTAQDWAGLDRYREANIKLGDPSSGERRVVFMGNSITESWATVHAEFFKQKGFICRGISGQTSSQMLLRFRQDVLNLKPSLIILMAGTNDIAENTGPISLDDVLGNIKSMAELARDNDIPIILCSVLPAKRFSWRPDLHPADKIIILNTLIKTFAESEGFIYLDYFSSMVDNKDGLKAIFTRDGVHPNQAGYEHMEKILNPVIKKILTAG